MHAKILGLIILVLLIIPNTIIIAEGNRVGYLAIKDYLGTIWTMDDVQKIINYHYKTVDGKNVSLADYFWVVVDDDPKNKKYNLRNFTASPLDGKTAVLALPAGDHYVDIYWFGYHQRQLVHIVENTHYVLNLETAPVVPFPTAGESSTNAEWDLIYDPLGLRIQRRDGKAFVQFLYTEAQYGTEAPGIIEVAWYDDDTGWNYEPLNIYVNGALLQYSFHIKDPDQPKYYAEYKGNVNFYVFNINWDIYKVEEVVKWNRTGEILHVSYITVIAYNEKYISASLGLWNALRNITRKALEYGWISPLSWTITSLGDLEELEYNAFKFYSSIHFAGKKVVVVVWDVFCTPTQIVIFANAYNGETERELSITSPTGFVKNNRLVYVRQLHGGIENKALYSDETLIYSTTFTASITVPVFEIYSYNKLVVDNEHHLVTIPAGNYYIYYLDDMSKYDYMQWFYISFFYTNTKNEERDFIIELYQKLILIFADTEKANVFEQRLISNSIKYERDSNTFVIIKNKTVRLSVWPKTMIKRLYLEDYADVEKLIPLGSRGSIKFDLYGIVKICGSYGDQISIYVNNIKYMHRIIPKIILPQISLLADGYYVASGAFGVQVFTEVFEVDELGYILGYYLLGNEPPPSFIIRDVYPDLNKTVVHYVWTIITADAYGQDIISIISNSTLNENNETIYNYYLSIKPTVRTYDNVTIALFNLNRMAFLHLNPEIVKYLLALPPGDIGFGIPVIDWNKIELITVDMTRPYELYYFDINEKMWRKVSVYTAQVNVTVEKQTYTVGLKPSSYGGDPTELWIYINDKWIKGTNLRMENGTIKADFNTTGHITKIGLSHTNQGYTDPTNVYIWDIYMKQIYNTSCSSHSWDQNFPNYFDYITIDFNITTDMITYNVTYATNKYIINKEIDNTTIETLEPNDLSKHYYKLVYTDTNDELKGWLWNDNGTLRMITGEVTWTISSEEFDKLVNELNIQGITDKWLDQWNQIAQKLGLVSQTLQNIASGITGAWDWLNRNKWLLLGGFFGFLVLLVLLMSAAGRPKVYVGVGRR